MDMIEKMQVALPVTGRHRQSLEYALEILTGADFYPYIEAVYLFGSCARKEQRYHSDVDLLVRVNDQVTPKLMRRMRAQVVPEEAGLPEVDLKFAEGNRYSSSYQFNENIKKEGKLIWEKN